MLKLTIVVAVTCAALLVLTNAEAAPGCDAHVRAGANPIKVMSGGQEQRVDLVMPSSFAPDKSIPLVIGLHPSGGTGADLDEDTGLSAAANAKGFAVMFPDGAIKRPRANGGYGHFWNIPGVPLIGGDAVPSGTRDDVRFIADAIDQVVKHNCVDARRIYVTGMSGGARMSSMVGCRLADRVTAVAPVAGLRAGRAASPGFTEPETSDCQPSRSISVLAIHGTDDPTNPFPGGDGLRWGYSIERAAARWASLDKCDANPATEKVSEHVSRVRYTACGSRSEVMLYRIELPRDQGGGHVWPGGQGDLKTRAAPAASAGSTAAAGSAPTKPVAAVELDATKVVLDFFAQH
jgi:polyhydroxybutyrate depolymerase